MRKCVLLYIVFLGFVVAYMFMISTCSLFLMTLVMDSIKHELKCLPFDIPVLDPGIHILSARISQFLNYLRYRTCFIIQLKCLLFLFLTKRHFYSSLSSQVQEFVRTSLPVLHKSSFLYDIVLNKSKKESKFC